MDKLENLKFKTKTVDRYDFVHFSGELFDSLRTNLNKVILKDATYKLMDETIDENGPKILRNTQVVEDKLGIYNLIYNLTQAHEASGKDDASRSILLRNKLARAIKFRDLICNMCLEIIQILYWIDIQNNRKSNVSLTECFNFAVGICKELSDKFYKRIDDEYNIAKAIETEFKKSGNIKP